jgi:hypothetical protein
MAEAPSDHRSVIFTPLGTGARTRAEGIPRAPRGLDSEALRQGLLTWEALTNRRELGAQRCRA